MKLDEINFVERRGHYNSISEINSGIVVKSIKNGDHEGVGFIFYNLDFLKGFSYLRVGFAGDRVYFIPSNEKDNYKLTRTHARYDGCFKVVLSGDKAEPFKSHVREKCYNPEYDEECGGWFIEKGGDKI